MFCHLYHSRNSPEKLFLLYSESRAILYYRSEISGSEHSRMSYCMGVPLHRCPNNLPLVTEGWPTCRIFYMFYHLYHSRNSLEKLSLLHYKSRTILYCCKNISCLKRAGMSYCMGVPLHMCLNILLLVIEGCQPCHIFFVTCHNVAFFCF